MKNLKSNQQGMVLPIVLISSVLIAIVGITVTLHQKQMLAKYQYENSSYEREKLYDEVKSTLSDQDNCNIIFKNQDVSQNHFSIDVSENNLIKNIYNKIGTDNQFVYPNYKVTKINADCSVCAAGAANCAQPGDVLTSVNSPLSVKQCLLKISIVPKNNNLMDTVFSKTFGNQDVNNNVKLNEAIYLKKGTNNSCSIKTSFISAKSNYTHLSTQLCESLGGLAKGSNCFVKQYGLTPEGTIDYSDSSLVKNQSSFSEALCALEYKALQRGGHHLVSNSGKNEFLWTSFCAQPKWAGCRRKNLPDGEKKIQGEEYSDRGYEGHRDGISKAAEKIINETVSRRIVRVANEMAASNFENNTNTFSTSFSNTATQKEYLNKLVTKGGVGNVIGNKDALEKSLILSGTGVGSVISGMAVFGGPVGMVVGAAMVKGLINSLFKGCNQSHIDVSYRCNEGYSEADVLHFYVDKVTFKGLKRKCKSTDKGTVDVPSEIDLKAKLIKPNITLASTSNLIPDETEVAIMNQYLGTISGAITLSELYAASDASSLGPDESLPSEAVELPANVLNAFVSKEKLLWNQIYTEVKVLEMKLTQKPTQGNQTQDEWNNTQKIFYASFENEVQNKLMEITTKIIQAKTVEGRPISQIKPTITTVYNPLLSLSNEMIQKMTQLGSQTILQNKDLTKAYNAL